MKFETISELKERLDGLVLSIDAEDLDDEYARQFVESKYLTLSLHAHSEGDRLKKYLSNNNDKLKYQKHLKIYSEIDSILGGKLSDYSTIELHSHITQCQEVVSRHA